MFTFLSRKLFLCSLFFNSTLILIPIFFYICVLFIYRLRYSIKEVSNAIVSYVNESKPDSKPNFIWLESSFVGTKPLDSPATPIYNTTADILNNGFSRKNSSNSRRSSTKREQRTDIIKTDEIPKSTTGTGGAGTSDNISHSQQQHHQKRDLSYLSNRMESIEQCTPLTINNNGKDASSNKMSQNKWSPIETASSIITAEQSTAEQQSTIERFHNKNAGSASASAIADRQGAGRANVPPTPDEDSTTTSPTLEDILDSLLALRRPQKRNFKGKLNGTQEIFDCFYCEVAL